MNFDGLFHLAHNVAVYVPSTMDVNREIDNADYVKRVQSTLSELFGGNTAYYVEGSWVSEDKGLVIEKVTICKSFADDLTEDKLAKVYELAANLKTELSQEAISVEIDGALYFV